MMKFSLIGILALCSMPIVLCWSVDGIRAPWAMAEIPSFSVAVELSDEATESLRVLGETIKVITYFDGDGMPLVPGRKTAPFRDVLLWQAVRELPPDGGIADFSHVVFPRDFFDHLDNPEYYHVTINILSWRRAVDRNLLRATTYTEPIGFFSGRTIVATGGLIFGE